MKKFILFFLIFAICGLLKNFIFWQINPVIESDNYSVLSFTNSWTRSNQSIDIYSIEPQWTRVIKIDHVCQFPFNPKSIILIILFFDEGMEYIEFGEKRCAWHFTEKIEKTLGASGLLPKYFQEKLFENIKKAKKRFQI